jgi:SAM-dependent methyltransferase
VANTSLLNQDGHVDRERLRTSYDVVARKYESRFLDELAGKPRDRELLAAFSESVRDPVVEIGCGPGQIGAFVRARGRLVIGVDLSTDMARLARGRLDGAVVADMRSLPFASGRLGGLVAFYSLIHLQRAELGAVLREFFRVLQPGGRVLFSAHEGTGDLRIDRFLDEPVEVTVTYFELEELVRACEIAGLAVTRAERRTPYGDESTVRLYVEATSG